MIARCTTLRVLPALLVVLTSGAAAQDAGPTVHVQSAKLSASDATPFDNFGLSVALDVSGAGRAVLGAPSADLPGAQNAGAAYVYALDGSDWVEEAKLTAGDAAPQDQLARSVALDGATLVVGSDWADLPGEADAGAAYVFVRGGTTWSQQAKLTADVPDAGDHFGFAVAVSGDTLLVGAHAADVGPVASAGAAYVFVRSGTTWSQEARFTAFAPGSNERFGAAVALETDRAVVGAYNEPFPFPGQIGAVYVFERTGTTWDAGTRLVASDAHPVQFFGDSVALSGDRILVGASHDDGAAESAGAAYVFVYDGSSWTEEAKLTAYDAATADLLGESVGLSGDLALVSARADDSSVGADAGSAYLFERSVLQAAPEGPATWLLRQKVTPIDAVANHQFARAVAIEGTTLLCGTHADAEHGELAGAGYVLTEGPAIEPFCFGTLADCPCGNAGLAGRGCENADGTGGVELTSASFTPDFQGGGSAVFEGTGYPLTSQPGVVLFRSRVHAPSFGTLGDGILCAGVPVVRMSAALAVGGQSTHAIGHGAGAGTFTYQLWYRSQPASYCDPTAAHNTSNALRVVWP